MDRLEALSRLAGRIVPLCRIPSDLTGMVSVAEQEVPAQAAGASPEAVERVWKRVESLYRTGAHPALQICIRHGGHVLLERAIGHASGNGPNEAPQAPKRPATVDTRFNLFSAAKAITAMVIHKLDEKRALHLEDRVCDFIPEFGRYGKDRITIRHILAHRAGIPNLPPGAIDLDLLQTPDHVIELLCEARPRTRPGRLVAYHAVSGGFILAEVVKRATGSSIREVFEKEIALPLGLHRTSYGVPPSDVDQVAVNAATGPPLPPPLSWVLRGALGVGVRKAVELSNDPRFLTSIIAAANVVTTAGELATFYDCLLDEGRLGEVRVFDPRTVRHATSEQSYWEIDLTLGLPIRYGLGFMLGSEGPSLFGWNNPRAFGHVGFTNVLSWADPQRRLAVALLTSGKPILGPHVARLVQLMVEIGRAFPKVCGSGTGRRRFLDRAPSSRSSGSA
ncbi:MAG: class A beta-lactamase-related serine hydrolase [Myxococcales bacterium]|nr:MAG: class A beta-lactamase-related serine hydrolase [Myxococcales bacterium]